MRYEILGETLPVVICHLESGEKMVTEGGGMSWMSPNMKMETTSNGGIPASCTVWIVWRNLCGMYDRSFGRNDQKSCEFLEINLI